ncbi:unnamed protein product [Amoebophrya sp. A25]|nr:unnamed protein product [Amoebophrya sp. A25]|eukprot:GSA25T00012522001.1
MILLLPVYEKTLEKTFETVRNKTKCTGNVVLIFLAREAGRTRQGNLRHLAE